MTSVGRRDWRSDRRQKILSSAADLFGRSAYDAVQMRDIAAAAGVGKPTLYRYFPSKDDLFLQVFKQSLDGLEGEIAAILADQGSARAALARLITVLVGALGGQVAALKMLTDDQSQVMQRWRHEFRRRRKPIADAVRIILQRGMAAGEFRPLDLDAIPSMVIAVVRGGLMGGADQLPRDRVTAAMVDFVMHALTGEARSAAAHAA